MMQTTTSLSRRRLLGGAAGALLAPLAGLSFAGSGQADGNRLVLMILRGGMDGLLTVPPVGDPGFAAARGNLARFEQTPPSLQGPFALHPALSQMHAMYRANQLAVVHAVGLPYRERSHFDAQQVLESGGSAPYQLKDGWLGRALQASSRKGLAISTAVPLVLRGSSDVDTWAPSALPDPSADLLQRMARMYGGDALLGDALARARGLRDGGEMPDQAMGGGAAGEGKGGRNNIVALATQAGRFLAQPTGPQVAVLDMGGWDSHAGEDGPKGPMIATLQQLDGALAALRDTLSAPTANGAWQRTVVVVATEFGRAVEINGTHGTDHGNASAAFVLGGSVQGGRVIGDWPGLARANRYEGRDLMSTTDLRGVFKGVLGEHLKISNATLDGQVFPGSAQVKPLSLLRG